MSQVREKWEQEFQGIIKKVYCKGYYGGHTSYKIQEGDKYAIAISLLLHLAKSFNMVCH